MRGLVVVNGRCDPGFLRELVMEHDTVVGVDGGCGNLLRIGVEPTIAIGDFDSFDPSVLSKSKVLEFPKDKDEMDVEIALDFCHNAGADEVTIACWEGERFDMVYALLGLMARYPEGWVELVSERLTVGIVKTVRVLEANIGEVWSILPVGDEVVLSLEGFKYALKEKVMRKEKPYGVSNVAVSKRVRIEVRRGEAVYFRWLKEPS